MDRGRGCDEALDALAAAEVAKSGDGEPEVWARLSGREDVRELLDLQQFGPYGARARSVLWARTLGGVGSR